MKWQDTSPTWQPQSMIRLQQMLLAYKKSGIAVDSAVDQALDQTVDQTMDQTMDQTADPSTVAGAGPTVNPVADRPSVEPAPISILVTSGVLTAIHAHLGRQMHEQGGLLIGEVFGDPAGQAIQVILIAESIASTEFDASAISLRMHSSIWSEARSRLNERRLIIGWYHSHPDLGAFFSATDRRTQAAFFSHPYSLGWVIDPIRSEQTWYLGASSDEISATQWTVLPD